MNKSISSLRAEVIERTIQLETIICVIISTHYLGMARSDFIFDFLYDEYCSFALKRRILLKTCPELSGDIEQKLNRINSIRNLFAHVGHPFIEGPDPNGPSRVPSPRDFNKSVDFSALHQEFRHLDELVLAALIAVLKSKGGEVIDVQSASN